MVEVGVVVALVPGTYPQPTQWSPRSFQPDIIKASVGVTPRGKLIIVRFTEGVVFHIIITIIAIIIAMLLFNFHSFTITTRHELHETLLLLYFEKSLGYFNL